MSGSGRSRSTTTGALGTTRCRWAARWRPLSPSGAPGPLRCCTRAWLQRRSEWQRTLCLPRRADGRRLCRGGRSAMD
eukprot:15478252-Alexandrium_andersonii.AAC.1